MLPDRRDLKFRVLDALIVAGGGAETGQLCDALTPSYPDLSPEDLKPDGNGDVPWFHLVRWAQQDLQKQGAVLRGGDGKWQITPAGRELAAAGPSRPPATAAGREEPQG